MLNLSPQTGDGIAESQNESGSPPGSPEFIIARATLSKRPGPNVGGCWVTIGKVRIRLKILNGKHGLFTAPPAYVYKGKNGRTYYARHVWLDPSLHQRIGEAVLEAFETRLAEDGRRVPRPVNIDHAEDDLDDDLGEYRERRGPR